MAETNATALAPGALGWSNLWRFCRALSLGCLIILLCPTPAAPAQEPGEQFVIRREVYQRIQAAFEANGIQFARPQVSVYVPPGGGAPDSDAVAGAVAGATPFGATRA